MNSIARSKSFVWLVFALSLFTLSGCGGTANTHEALADSMFESMDEMADALSSVEDEASANAAAAKIESLAASIKATAEKLKKLGDPSPEVKARLDKKIAEHQKAYQEKMMKVMGNMMTKPQLMGILQSAMDKVGNVME